MQGSGFQDRQWLVQRDGRFIQLTELLYHIAEHADGEGGLRAGHELLRVKPAQAIPVGQTVTATATNAGGSTSEFSFALGVSG